MYIFIRFYGDKGDSLRKLNLINVSSLYNLINIAEKGYINILVQFLKPKWCLVGRKRRERMEAGREEQRERGAGKEERHRQTDLKTEARGQLGGGGGGLGSV